MLYVVSCCLVVFLESLILSKAVPKSIVYTSRYEWKYISRFLKRFWVMNGSLRSYFVWSRNAFNLDNASVSIAITRFWMGKKIVLNSHQFQSSYFTLLYLYQYIQHIFEVRAKCLACIRALDKTFHYHFLIKRVQV